MLLDLSRQERLEICNCINEHLQKMAADYAASCDAKRPNKVLLRSRGQLMRLRDKLLTGKSYAQQDADSQRAAEASEMILRHAETNELTVVRVLPDGTLAI